MIFGGSREEVGERPRRKGVKMVGSQIPEDMYKLIEEHILNKEYVSVSDYIRDLIRKDLKERGLL